MIGGLSWLAGQLNANAGMQASYDTGAGTFPVTMVSQGGSTREYAQVIGDTPEETVLVTFPPEEGYCGFTVLVADMLLNGSPVLPARGHKITIGAEVYMVMAPENMMCFRYEGLPYKVWFWIHTRKR